MTLQGPVGIVGLGVMGGSLARALSEGGVEVRGFSPDPAEARAALEAGALVRVCGSVAESARGVGWWIVATPLAALGEVMAAGAPEAPPRVMDLASLQGPALAAAREAGLGDVHLSAHPMAGSERSGFAAARADLYREAPVWLSGADGAVRALGPEAEAFWAALGAAPRWTDPLDHDARMAAVSHLPQLAASALARVLAQRGVDPRELGPGGRDTTRLAGSSTTLWRDLLAVSGPAVAPLVRALAQELSGAASALEEGDEPAWTALLDDGRRWRNS